MQLRKLLFSACLSRGRRAYEAFLSLAREELLVSSSEEEIAEKETVGHIGPREGRIVDVHLKKIEIAGFKSFAERTVIEFDRGLTAVVGPNGSGKSNITEAIRWVLGEQSAKSLRGGKMPDIIFAGTTKRKPLNIAEVTVVLDNQQRFLPLDFAEVSVTRRLSRSGDSEFYINKQSCRLKDIIDLFMDSGLGKESFSIISQGKVEAIFNSKPEDRRGIFEEAAGVLKYKQRKRQAEQKLFETEDNLNRVQDIIFELETQLEPLQAQSEVAKDFLQLKEQLTSVDVGVTVAEIESLKAEWEEKEAQLVTLNQQLATVSQRIQTIEGQLTDLRDERSSLDEQLERAQTNLLRVTEGYQQAEGRKNVLAERSQNTAKTTTEYQRNLSGLETRLAAFLAEKAELEQQLADKQTLRQEAAATVLSLQELVQQYSQSAKERLAELRSEYMELMQQQANTSNDLKHLERQYEQETRKNQTAVKEHDDLQKKQADLSARQRTLAATISQQDETLTTLRESYSERQTTTNHAKVSLAQKEKQMYAAMGTLQQARARQKSLQELQENYAGFYQGVRAVLKAKDKLGGIVGAVAELLAMPAELTLGIETALGAAAQHVIVATEKDGRAAIDYLKQQRLGRATFLPLTTIKPRYIKTDVQQRLSDQPGFVGIASELVTYEPKIQPIVENLLGATILATDLRSASALAQRIGYQYRVVSLEGDVMNPGGSMTGGATKKGQQGNLFAQAEELKSLSSQVAQMEAALTSHEGGVRDLKNQVSTLEEELTELREAGEAARLQAQELQSQHQLLAAEAQQLEREQQAFERESQGLTQFMTSYAEQKARLTGQMDEIKASQQTLDAEMAQTDQLEARNQVRREEAQEQLKKAEARAAVMKEQVAHTRELLQSKVGQTETTQREISQLEEQLALLTSDLSSTDVSEASLAQQMVDFQAKRAAVEELLVSLKEQRQTVQRQLSQLEEDLTGANREQQVALTEKSQCEVKQSRAEVGLDTGLTYLQEEYSLTYAASKDLYPLTLDFEEGKRQIKQLKSRINQLGPVNLGAIEQFEEVNERYTFLTTQRDDLLEAKDSLFETMTEMDDVVKEKFGTVFTEIRGKFREVFPKMFGGGHADLVLTDPSDLLNTGIEIVAQPPGKKLQSLSLLSGGERALTAIALLFSIIQVRPVPFCILDEVEAALDEANVARFGQYLSRFEDETQFIVITHRKGTMEAADVLYGVTMEESGVSRIVSVRLEEINGRGEIDLDVASV